jgi:hypothetical protein
MSADDASTCQLSNEVRKEDRVLLTWRGHVDTIPLKKQHELSAGTPRFARPCGQPIDGQAANKLPTLAPLRPGRQSPGQG